jgi:TPP-dependent indolepyruvate ferredoxin oxidoreductase alpha subunit
LAMANWSSCWSSNNTNPARWRARLANVVALEPSVRLTALSSQAL